MPQSFDVPPSLAGARDALLAVKGGDADASVAARRGAPSWRGAAAPAAIRRYRLGECGKWPRGRVPVGVGVCKRYRSVWASIPPAS